MSQYVDFGKRIKATLHRIEVGSKNKNTGVYTESKVTPYNRKIIERYLDFMRGEGLSDARIDTNLDKVRIIAETLYPIELDKATRQDIERLTGSWEKATNAKTGKPWTAQTKATYRACLKKFYRWLLGERGQSPEQTYWVKTTIRQVERETYNPNQCFSEDDVKKLIDAAPDLMLKTFVAIGYDSACRPEEIVTAKVGHVIIDKNGTKMIVKGKMGERGVNLTLFPRMLSLWLNVHPQRENPDAPLWYIRSNNKGKKNKGKKNKGKKNANKRLVPLSYRGAYNFFIEICRKAKLKGKKWNLYNLRHSYATNGAKKGVPIEIMSKHLGHTNIKQTMKYYHLSDLDVGRALRKAHGEEIPEDVKPESKLKPKKCPRCDKINDATASFCNVCGAALSLELAQKMQDQQAAYLKEKILAEQKLDKNLLRQIIKEELAKKNG